MSWFYSTVIEAGSDLDAEDIQTKIREQNPDGLDQLDAAIMAAELLMDSPSLGDAKEYYVSMSGHANPGHKPREGWANDAITVSVAYHK